MENNCSLQRFTTQKVRQRRHCRSLADTNTPGYLDELQFEILDHLVRLTDPEDVSDDVLWRVPKRPKLLHHLIGLCDVSIHTVSQHAFHQQRVRLVTDSEDILTVDVAKAGVG